MHCRVCSYCELVAVMRQGLVWKQQTWPASGKVRLPFQITQIVMLFLPSTTSWERRTTHQHLCHGAVLWPRGGVHWEKLLNKNYCIIYMYYGTCTGSWVFMERSIHVATWKQWEQNSNKYWKHAAGIQAWC